MFGLSRKAVENEPLKIFMALSDVERNRRAPLEASTVDRADPGLPAEWGAQYRLFAEDPGPIRQDNPGRFWTQRHELGQIRDPLLRSDAVGADAGAFRIVADLRRGSKPSPRADSESALLAHSCTLSRKFKNERDAFDAGPRGR